MLRAHRLLQKLGEGDKGEVFSAQASQTLAAGDGHGIASKASSRPVFLFKNPGVIQKTLRRPQVPQHTGWGWKLLRIAPKQSYTVRHWKCQWSSICLADSNTCVPCPYSTGGTPVEEGRASASKDLQPDVAIKVFLRRGFASSEVATYMVGVLGWARK
eukprot:1145532-Pelagomonas_calceolata.AAC.3